MVDTPTLDNLASLAFLGPELALIGAILLVIIWDLAVTEQRRKVLGACAISMVALAFSAGNSVLFLVGQEGAKNLFGGLIAFDEFTQIFRILFSFVTALILVFAAPSFLSPATSGGEKRNAAEMFMLLLVLTLGMNLMAASRHLLMI